MLTAKSSAFSSPDDWRSHVAIEVSERQLPVRMRVGHLRTRLDHGPDLRSMHPRRPAFLLVVRSLWLALFRARG